MIIGSKGLGKLPTSHIDGPFAAYVPRPGFWGRLARKLVGAALDALQHSGPIIGWVAAYIDEQTLAWQNQKPVFDTTDEGTTYQPTRAEETILETWFTTKFNPFYNQLLKDLDTAMALPDLVSQIAGVNLAMAKMCAVLEHFKTNETTGLSIKGVQYRTEFIGMMFQSADKIIAKILDENPTSFVVTNAKIKTNPADFLPFTMPVATFDCQAYAMKDGNTTVPITTTTGNGTTVQTATGNTNTNTNGNSNNANGTIKKVVFGTLAFLALRETFKSKPKKTQTQNSN